MPWRQVFGLMVFYLVCSVVVSILLSRITSPIGDAVVAAVEERQSGQTTTAHSVDGPSPNLHSSTNLRSSHQARRIPPAIH